MIIDPIKIEGLSDFRRNLRAIDRDLPKAIRVAGNEAAELVVRYARPSVPIGKTGRARQSVRASSTQTRAQVTGGGKRVPYYPWLDFGGRVGRRRSVSRPFIPAGRAIYPAYTQHRDEVSDALLAALLEVVRKAGVEVDG